MAVYIDADDLQDFRRFYEGFPERASQALSLSINDTMRNKVLPAARQEIYAQVALPPGYLDNNDRLTITQFSTPTQLVGIVRGRDRPTSLAQFAQSDDQPSGKKQGRFIRRVTGARVKADGPTQRFRDAFLIDLKKGSAAGGNVGFAIRLRPGEKLTSVHSFDPIEIFPNVYLLYAPSVNQIFEGVSKDIEPAVMDYLQDQFTRQFVRLGQ